MSMDGASFYNYVVRTLKRTDKETEVYEAITDAVNRLEVVFPFTEKQTTTDLSIASGNYRISLPSGFSHLTASPTLIESGEDGVALEKMTIEEFNQWEPYPDDSEVSTSEPMRYAIYGSYIYLYPVSDGTYTLRLYYASSETSAITSGTAAVPFSDDRNRRMLKALTLSIIYTDLENDEQAAKWAAIAKANIDDILTQDSRNREAPLMMKYND